MTRARVKRDRQAGASENVRATAALARFANRVAMPQHPRGTMQALDPEPLLRFLHRRGVEHILIGGIAVAAHGHRRPSRDLGNSPDLNNLI